MGIWYNQMEVVMQGTILSQPQLLQDNVIFILKCGETAITVIRKNREAQKRDILFLCVGQQVLLLGCLEGSCVIADRIRIIDCGQRNYLLDTNEIGEKFYGNSAIDGNDASHS